MSTSFCAGSFPMLRSMTVRRFETPTCGPARPMPCDAYMVSNMSATSLRRWASNSVTGSPGCERTGSGYFRIFRIIADFSITPDLFNVAIKIPFHLKRGVAAKLLLREARDHESHHGFGGHTRGGHHADIAALVAGAGGFARIEADGFERPPQRRDGLQISSHHNVFAVRHAAFDAAGIVPLAREAGRFAGVAFGVVNRVMNL